MHGQMKAGSPSSTGVGTLRSLPVPLAVGPLLDAAQGLATALVRRHARAGVHGGLSPDTVLLDAEGHLTLLDRPGLPPHLARYAAPEQSGRLSRCVDERADLYALGVLLFELATGELPFGAGSPAELTRAQLTGPAPAASELRADLPPGVDGVLGALLATLPEDRYRTARGVLADIRRCQDELEATGAIAPFPPGRLDMPTRLAFTGRLFGRRGRLGQLVSARERVARTGRVELISVSADPGLGKSALLGAFCDGIIMGGGWVARTGFSGADAAPYAALGRLLADLAEHLTMHCGGQVDPWRIRLAEELGGTAPVLAALAPRLAPLLGVLESSPVPAVQGRRAESLLHLGVRRLLSAVASTEGPLVLALDDLHRADPASVELLHHVLSDPETGNLLVVAALRPKEVPAAVTALLRGQGPGRSGGSLALRPLPDIALGELLADTLRAGQPEAADLARVVADRTGSSPLAVAEFLRERYEQRQLSFDEPAGIWKWDRLELAGATPVHDVLPAIHSRVAKLPARLLRMLQVAAVLGGPVDVAVLVKVTGTTPDNIQDMLRAAVRDGLLAVAPGTGRYRWPHEVVRRAVCATLRESERGEFLATVGRMLLGDAKGADAHLVVQLCAAAPTSSLTERAQLAGRALAAGRHAYQIGAVDAARERMLAAVDLLPPSGWARRAPLAYAVHLHAARTTREAGDLDRADDLLDRAAGYAADDLARAEVLALRARWRRADGHAEAARSAARQPLEGRRADGHAEAARSAARQPMEERRADGHADAARTAGRQALELLGVPVPADPARWGPAARTAAAALTRRLADIHVDEIARGLMASDPRVVLALEVIADAVTLTDRPDDWTALLAAVGVRLAFDFGPTPAAALAFAGHATVLAHRAGYRDSVAAANADAEKAGAGAACAARVALALMDSCPAPGYAARVAPVAGLVRALWYDPEALPLVHLDRGYRSGIEDGEPTLALDNLVLSIAHRFVLGTPLGTLADELDSLWRLADRYGARERVAVPAAALADAVTRLGGLPTEVPATDGSSPVARTVSLVTACLLGDHARARELAPDPKAGTGSFLAAVAAFYHALALVDEYPAAVPQRQDAILAQLEERQARVDEWAGHGPGAFSAYAALLYAERTRLRGQPDEAAAAYQRAVDSARKQQLGTVEALAAELGGRHALARGETASAVAYLRRARDCYHRWGTPALVAHVDRTLAAVPTRPHRAFDQLDLLGIVRAFQAIAGELSQDRLVVTLLSLLIEHTHAERGALLLPVPEDSGLRLAATARAERGGIVVVADPEGLATETVPDAVVEHVFRRRVPIGGRPDELPGRLSADRYLRHQAPAALLCTPILRDDRLMAVLYLEHRHLATWFGAEHLDLLDVLCAQAAIALDNASMHARLIEANQVLDATFDRLPVGLILLGPDLTVRRASPRAVQVTGLPIHPGTPLVDLFDVLTPTDADGLPYRLEPGFAPVGEDSAPIHRDVLIILPNGERQRVNTSAIPLRGEAGELIGVTLLVSPASGLATHSR